LSRRDVLALLGAGAVGLISRGGFAYASPGPDSLPGRRAQAVTTGPPAIPSAINVRLDDGSTQSMDMEEYLKGVVPAEAIPSWHANALRAQAVAARTYAASYVATYGYICGTSACQNWDPSRRTAATDAAVEATRGELMTYQGGMIWSYYSSTCGGQTATSPDQASAYCTSVRCMVGVTAEDLSSEAKAAQFWRDSQPSAYCSPSSLYRWSSTISRSTAESIIDRYLPGNATPSYQSGQLGQLTSVAVTSRAFSGKATNLRIDDTWNVGAELAIRSVLRTSLNGSSLPSANVIVSYDGASLTRAGGGFGHGIGLCQYGAQGMALAGYEYHAILQRYYSGVCFVRVTPASYSAPSRSTYRLVLPWSSRTGAVCG
jgi:stage II sporulation protein D